MINIMMVQATKKQLGFTLIEMIVSLGVFATVVTIAVGSLLMMIAANEQLQAEQSVMTNLSFALDSMTREIRTGTDYYCVFASNFSSANADIFKVGNNLDTEDYSNSGDCSTIPTGQNIRGLVFKESGDSISLGNERILFFYDGVNQKLFRRIGSEAPVPITSSDIQIIDAGFYVTGSNPLNPPGSTDATQAAVTIVIEATDRNGLSSTTIQTTVTQRTLDL